MRNWKHSVMPCSHEWWKRHDAAVAHPALCGAWRGGWLRGAGGVLLVAESKAMGAVSEKQYVVLHSNPEGFVISQSMRDHIFGTGTVVDVIECPTYSLKQEYIKSIVRRPLTVVLWGMEDRYDVAAKSDVEVIPAKDYGEVMSLCEGRRCLGVDESRGYRRSFWGIPGEDDALAKTWLAPDPRDDDKP